MQAESDRGSMSSEKRMLEPIERVKTARDINRVKIDEYVQRLFSDFFQQKGDGLYGEDPSIYGGIALFDGRPVTVIGHRKGNNTKENVRFNFGMPSPEGYRKALRIMKQAEKFHRPVITFVDTPGAYPGMEAEMNGQSQAISMNLAQMSALKVPIITIVTGEGSSGGALGIAVANSVYMLENAVYSVLSPEGFASILWHDASKVDQAAKVMKMTAEDLLGFGLIKGIIEEGDLSDLFDSIHEVIEKELKRFDNMTVEEIVDERFEIYRNFDKKYLVLKQ